MAGFVKGRKLPKIGLQARDTVELTFTDVTVPTANRLGEEGQAFGYLGVNLPQERLAIAVGSVAQSRAALDLTIEYVRTRRSSGSRWVRSRTPSSSWPRWRPTSRHCRRWSTGRSMIWWPVS